VGIAARCDRGDPEEQVVRARRSRPATDDEETTLTTEDRRPETALETPAVDPGDGTIRATGWQHFDSGAMVLSADGEAVGTVRERMPAYLEVRAKRNLLTDEELYIPRELVERVDGDTVYLNQSAEALKEMNLSTLPALQ
jgi:hypothetical protein